MNRNVSRVAAMVGLIVGISCGALPAAAGDWDRWRGPTMDGISPESDWDPRFLSRPLKLNWQVAVGAGYSNVSVSADRLYTMGFDKENNHNILYCLDVANGAEVWRYSYPATTEQYLGPRGTPVIDQGLVYSLGQDGDFVCNDAGTGQVVWRRSVAEEFKAPLPKWMFASSVYIQDELAVVNVGKSGLALHKKTGELIWQSERGTANYATPTPYRRGGKTSVAIFGKQHLYGVDPFTGAVQWTYPWQTSYDVNAADPGIFGEKLFVSSGYRTGCSLIDISQDNVVELWRNKNLSLHFSSPIIIDGFVYGINGNTGSDAELVCMDLSDGSVRWKHEVGFSNLMAANRYLILINERGTMRVVKADPASYQEMSRQDGVLGRLCWTAPVLSRGALYVRNSVGELKSIAVAAP